MVGLLYMVLKALLKWACSCGFAVSNLLRSAMILMNSLYRSGCRLIGLKLLISSSLPRILIRMISVTFESVHILIRSCNVFLPAYFLDSVMMSSFSSVLPFFIVLCAISTSFARTSILCNYIHFEENNINIENF